MASNCKIIEGRCGPRQLCWTKSGKIKSNRAVTSAFGIKVPVARTLKRFVARGDCLTPAGKLRKGFRFVGGRCKRVGTPGMRGVKPTNREGLTWMEWRNAANLSPTSTKRGKRAWSQGEDPSDWRAAAVQSYPRAPSKGVKRGRGVGCNCDR